MAVETLADVCGPRLLPPSPADVFFSNSPAGVSSGAFCVSRYAGTCSLLVMRDRRRGWRSRRDNKEVKWGEVLEVSQSASLSPDATALVRFLALSSDLPQGATHREDNYCSIAVIHCASSREPKDVLKLPENWVKLWRKCVTSGNEDGPSRTLKQREEERSLIISASHTVPSRPPLRLQQFTFFS